MSQSIALLVLLVLHLLAFVHVAPIGHFFFSALFIGTVVLRRWAFVSCTLLLLLSLSMPAHAAQVCNVCLYTPAEVNKLTQGKAGRLSGEKEASLTLPKPLFAGELYFAVDAGEKTPLPKDKGVFFSLADRKRHSLKILGPTGKSWAKVTFDCAEYEHGTKIVFESAGAYSAGWKTFPFVTCPWRKR